MTSENLLKLKSNNTQSVQSNEIQKRLYNVMLKIDEIPKNGFNEHSQYAYVKAVDIVRGVRQLLLDNKIGLRVVEEEIVRELLGKNMHCKIKCTATFFCVDNPLDAEIIPYFTVSSDRLDKDIFKAKTNGLKYVFIQRFLIPSDDGLTDSEEPQREEKEKFKERKEVAISKNYNNSRNQQDNSNRNNYKQENNYGQSKNELTPGQYSYIMSLQERLPGLPMYSVDDIRVMDKKDAGNAIDNLRRECEHAGIAIKKKENRNERQQNNYSRQCW